MNSKMSLDLALNQNFVSADQFSSYNEWSTMDWLNYQFWPRLNAALGAGGGYDNESVQPRHDLSNNFKDGSIGAPPTKSVSNSTAAWKSASF